MKVKKAVCAIFMLAYVFFFAGSEETNVTQDGEVVSFPVGSSLDATVWIAPPPQEKPFFTGIVGIDGVLARSPAGARSRKIVRACAFSGICAGLALSAGGLGTFFSAAGDGIDTMAMHKGLLMVISGSLVSSLFSVLLDASSATSPE